jgi:hypothetical protein
MLPLQLRSNYAFLISFLLQPFRWHTYESAILLFIPPFKRFAAQGFFGYE